MAYEAPDENMLKQEQLKLDIYTKSQPIIGRLKKAGVDVGEFETEINGILPDRGVDLKSTVTAVPKLVSTVALGLRDGKSFTDTLKEGAEVFRKETEPFTMTSRKVITDYIDTAKDFFNMPKIETPERKLNEIQYKQSMATNPVSTVVRDVVVDPFTYVTPSSKLLQAESALGRFAKGATVNAPIVGGSYALREGGKDNFSLENALIATGAGGVLGGLVNIPFGKSTSKAQKSLTPNDFANDEEKARRMLGDEPLTKSEVLTPFNQQIMDDWSKFQKGEMPLEELKAKYQHFKKQPAQIENNPDVNIPSENKLHVGLENTKTSNEISQRAGFTGSPMANTIVAGGAGSTAPIDYNQDGEVSTKERALSALLASVSVNIPSIARNAGKTMQTAKEAPNSMRSGMINNADDIHNIKDIEWDKLSKKEASKIVRILNAIPNSDGVFKSNTIVQTNDGKVKVTDLFANKEQKHLDNPALRGMVTTPEVASFAKVSKVASPKYGFQGTTWNAKADDGSHIVYGAKAWDGENNLITVHSKTEAGERGRHASNVSSGNINDTVSMKPSNDEILSQSSNGVNPSLGVPAIGAGMMATSEQLKADDGSMSPLGNMLALAGAGALAYKFGGKALDVANKVGSKAITSTAKVMDDLTANRISKTWDNFTSNRIVDAFLGTKIYKLDDYIKMRGDYTKSLNPTLETLEKLHVQLAEFSPQTREAMYDYMTGVKGVQLPTNLKNLADGFTKEIDTLSQELVKYGALSQEQANAFKGQYLHRQYTSKMKDLFSFGGDRKTLSDVKHRGRVWEGSEAEYNTYLRSGALGDFMDGKIVAQQQANGKYKFYQDWSPEQRAKWGEVKDVAFSIPETMSMLHERLENAKFLNAIAGDARYVAPKTMSHEDAISNGYVKLEGKRYGQLSGKYLIPEIASDIKAFADAIHGSDGQFAGMADAWKKAVSYLKSTHTIYSPTAHVNNLMSNLTFQFAEGVNNPIKMVANFTKGAIAHRKANELLRLEAIGKVRNLTPDETKSLSALSIDDDVLLFKEAKLKGLFGKSQLNDTLNQYIKPRTQYKDGLVTKIHQKAGSIYGAEDDMMRFSLLKTLKEMNPNQSIDTLVDRVNNTIPDYSKPMSSVARKLRDTGFVPFIGFTYHAMPIMLRQMKERPASVAALAGMMSVIYGMNDINPFSNEDIPDEGYAFKRLPIMQNGNIVTTIKVDKWVPHYDMLSSMTDFSQGAMPEFIRGQLVGGIPQNIVGGLANYNPYFNQRITQKEGAQKAYQLVKYNVQQATPDVLDNAYNLVESKLLDTKTRRYNKVIEPRTTGEEVAKILGVNIQSYNKAEQARKTRSERMK
ncbi:MAG: hypothetical protein EOM41_06685 [Bacilli bacterium]|nr:hypothetical protein [Bacilli bacterium]